MVGKTNVAGARLRSVIAVTYPAGSVCTCTNGTKTFTAKDTSGKALFNVTVGEWTVTARTEDGSKEKSVDAAITYEGQVESVKLSYEQYLYKDGEQFTDVTGGWTTYNPAPDGSDIGTVSYGEGGIEMWCDGSKRYVYVASKTTNMIDLTNFNTLQFTSVHTYGHIRQVAVSKMLPGVGNAAELTISETGNQTVDISALSGEYYIFFMCMNQEYIDTGLKVNNVLLK